MQELPAQNEQTSVSIFTNKESFEFGLQVARVFTQSTMVPAQYQGEQNLGSAMIAINMAKRLNSDPFMIMQNLDIIYGKPAFNSKFIIASINSSGKYDGQLDFVFGGTPNTDSWSCKAVARTKDGRVLNGPAITIHMAKEEGWTTRKGSKWGTMPELMLQYRAAAFFSRLHCPELLMGLQSTEEMYDVESPAQENKTAFTVPIAKEEPKARAIEADEAEIVTEEPKAEKVKKPKKEKTLVIGDKSSAIEVKTDGNTMTITEATSQYDDPAAFFSSPEMDTKEIEKEAEKILSEESDAYNPFAGMSEATL